MNYFKAIDEISKKNHGIITSKDLDAILIPRVYLSRLIKADKLVRISRGIYKAISGDYDEYYFLYLKYKKIIYSFQCALYFNGLTDRMPYQREVTLPSSYNSSKYPDNVIVHKAINIYYNLGKTMVKTSFGNLVPCYNKERTIIDMIRYRDKMDAEIFIKAIKSYHHSKDKNITMLIDYAKIFNIEKKVFEIMELVENE
jgi:predicted transcriptional regulator of viral defense system